MKIVAVRAFFKKSTLYTSAFVVAFSTLTALVPFILAPKAAAISPSEVVYDALPSVVPSTNYPSEGFQATSTSQFADSIHLGGSNRVLNNVTVTMSNWAKFSDYSSDPTYSGNSTSWSQPLTLNVYSSHLGANGVPDTLLATKTQSFNIPWRPESDPTCSPTSNGNGWLVGSTCYNFSGIANNVTFDLTSLGVTLPSNVIVGVAYDTQSYGAHPTGVAGPYNSLNVAVPNNQPVSIGSDNDTNSVFWDTTYPGYTAGLKQDSGWSPNGTIAMKITASALPSTTETVTGNTSAGENLPGWMFNRDPSTVTPFSFNAGNAVLGLGSIDVAPIAASPASNKFIAENFVLSPVDQVTKLSVDYKLKGATPANQVYMNVYANYGSSSPTKFYDCRYNVVATTGSNASFSTLNFDIDGSYDVTTHSGSATCPSTPANMGAGSTIRDFSFSVGDTTASDAGFGAYFDKAVVGKVTGNTIYDFEPIAPATPANLRLNGDQPCGYITNTNWITPTWDAVPDAVSYNYKVTLPNGSTYGPTNLGNVTSVSGAFGGEGLSTFSVQAVAANGLTSGWANDCAVTYDATAPAVPTLLSPSDNAYQNFNDFNFDWSDVAGASEYEFQSSQDPTTVGGVLVNGVWNNKANGAPDRNFLTASEIHSYGASGTWYWQVRAIDAAGNKSAWTAPWKVTLDSTSPTATMSFPSIGPGAISYDVQYSEAVNPAEASNPANYFLHNWVGAGGSGDLTGHATVSYNPVTYKATVTFTTPGWYVSPEQQWGVENIHDLAGNLLNTSPTTAYSTPNVAPGNPGTPTTASPPTSLTSVWNWAAAVDPNGSNGSGIKNYEYAFVNDGDTPSTWTATTDTTTTTTAPADGTYQLHVRAIDNAGNVGGEAVGSVTIDTTAPVINIPSYTTLANVIRPNATSDGTATSFAWEQTDGPVGGVDISDPAVLKPDFTVNTDGTYQFKLTATDSVGNATAKLFSFTYQSPVTTASTDSTPTPTTLTPQTVAFPATPTIVGPGFSNAAVLGTSTQDPANNNSGVQGASTAKTTADAVHSEANQGTFLGFAWYWWLLIIAAIVSLIWWITSAIRNRQAQL
jgi:hypothetical protein